MFVLNVLEKPLEKILFKEVRKMAYKSKKEWYEKNKKNLRAREKTRAWKDYRNTRKKIDKYFENLDFKKKIYIIKAIENYLKNRPEISKIVRSDSDRTKSSLKILNFLLTQGKN